jgi:hypothetical protein
MEAIEVDCRYSQDQLEALFRQARREDVEQGGRFDTGSAAINIWTHTWTSPALRDESSLMGTFYAAWADENRLWKAEVEEGFSLDDLLEVLGELEIKALGMRIHGR